MEVGSEHRVVGRRRLTTRVSAGHLVMLLSGALGVLLTLNVLRAADRTEPVLVAATDLVPGTVIGDAAVRTTRLHADATVGDSLFAATDLDAVRGQVVTATIREGALLTRRDVRPISSGAATRAMSFPLPRSRAVAGKLGAGDRVDVIVVERDTGSAGYVATDVEVLDTDGGDRGPLGSGDDVTITVAVDDGIAPRLASALEVGTVSLVRSTGAGALRDVPPFTPATGSSTEAAAASP